MKKKILIETIEDIADILWLSKYKSISSREIKEDIEKVETIKDNQDSKAVSENYNKLYYETDIFDDANSVPIKKKDRQYETGSSTYRAPKKQSLSFSKEWEKSLKAIRRKITASNRLNIDEEKTVEKIAEQGLFDVVLKKEEERFYSLYILIDSNTTMNIWNDLIDDFSRILEKTGTFLRIWYYYLDSSDDEAKVYQDIDKKRIIDISKVTIGSHRDLIWIVSDCLGNSWKSGDMFHQMQRLSKHSFTSIIQMFPKRMWMGTALYKGEQEYLHSKIDTPLNRNLSFMDDNRSKNNIKIPVLSLDHISMKSYADVLKGISNTYISGIVLDKEKDYADSNIERPVLSAEDRTRRFYSQASPMAQKMAFYMSALPIDYDLTLILKEEMFPEGDLSHVSEVYLGGIIQKKEVDDKVTYDFYPGVRERLNSNISALDSLEILNKMAPYINSPMIQDIGLERLLTEPDSILEDFDTFDTESKEFIKIAISSLRRLGGNYYKTATHIGKYIEGNNEKEYHVVDKNKTVRGEKEFLDEYQHEIIYELESMSLDELDNYKFENHSFPSDDNMATISSKGSAENIDIVDVVEVEDRHYKLSITFELETILDMNIYKSDFYGNEEYQARYKSVEELNKHYISVEDNYLLKVQCTVEVEFDENDELLDINIISFDDVDISKCHSDARAQKVIERLQKEHYESELNEIKEQVTKSLSQHNIKELESYVIQDDPRFIEQYVKILERPEYIPMDVKVIDIEYINIKNNHEYYKVKVSFDVNTYIGDYIHKSDFYSNKELMSDNIPYVDMNYNDFVVVESNCLINVSANYIVTIDGGIVSHLDFMEILDIDIKDNLTKDGKVESDDTTYYCEQCSKQHSIECDSIDWEVVDADDRQMGIESHYESTYEDICDCGQQMAITFHCWEYPVGVINYTDIEYTGIKDLSNSCYPSIQSEESKEIEKNIYLDNFNNRNYDKRSAVSIYKYAKQFEGKSLIDVLSTEELISIHKEINEYDNRRKGHFGDLIERYLFGIENNSDARADFFDAGVELKTTPLKRHAKNEYVAKERLVFSMINYMDIINEKWETSSFLKKNKFLLLMFYLYEKDIDLTQYEFKLIHLLDLLSDISVADITQIKKDWQTIVDKIKAGEAHLLSEGDTVYLGAATKASKATDRRHQPNNNEPAKPRALSLKPTYMNFLIQKYLKKKDLDVVSLFDNTDLPMTVEEIIENKFSQFLGKTNLYIEKTMGISYDKRPKSHRRVLINRLLGTNSNKIEEFEKANITLKVIALEESGRLVEAISFPIFRYETIVEQTWEESEFYEQLSTKRFLFIIFRKTKNTDEVIFEKYKFWNFPMKDIEEARWVWEETVNRIINKKADSLPRITENSVAHVRPHARNKQDTLPTGYGTFEMKKSFWLNAKYIEKQLLDD